MRQSVAFLTAALALAATLGFAAEEGTRHIQGEGVDMYFMNDKVFGTVASHPLWAIYNCGTDIKGEMDVDGSYQEFAFQYHEQGDLKITGTFAGRSMALGAIDKVESGFVYHVFVEDRERTFSIRYEQLENEHLVNSIIEGQMSEDRALKLTVDGRLCPFATTGIILISLGASLSS